MEILKNKFGTWNYIAEKSLMEEIYNLESENIKDKEMKKLMRQLIELFEKYKPKYYYSDLRNFRYAISPEMQKWIDDTVVVKAIQIEMKKTARIMSTDYISQLSIEQLTQEENYETGMLTNRFFDNEKEAREWLEMTH